MLALAVLLVSSDVLAPVLLVESLVAPIVLEVLVSVELGDVVLTLELLVSGDAARDWSVVGSVVLLALEEGVVLVDELP
jgi:hypothetical protein